MTSSFQRNRSTSRFLFSMYGMIILCSRQCCGNRAVGTGTFCRSGTGTVIYDGTETNKTESQKMNKFLGNNAAFINIKKLKIFTQFYF
jgi:hypothetical protein